MKSLRAQLYLAIAIAVMVSVALSLLAGAWLVHRSVKRQDLKALVRQVEVIATRERSSPLPVQRVSRGVFLGGKGHERLWFVDPATLPALLPDRALAELRHGRAARGTLVTGGARFLFAARGVSRRETVILLRSAKDEAGDWTPFGISFLIAGGVGAAVAALLAFLLARAITRPIKRVAVATRRLAEGESHEPIPEGGAEELEQLASGFNHMAEELAKARDAERAFLLSVSHELKTPLTAIRGHAEALTEDVMTPVEAGGVITREAARLERLVRDLLDLARLNHRRGFSVERAELDLGEVVQETALRYESQARVYDIELTASAERGARAIGDHDRVLQVLSNLVENALRITPPGGSVSVGAERGRLLVSDTGPGLADDELPHAFDRFYLYDRYASERKVGTGLGLAIVKELVDAMGGRVEVRSARGAGTTFVVTLPDVPAPVDAVRL
jgi:two-component system sensor histidine kinase BaeS